MRHAASSAMSALVRGLKRSPLSWDVIEGTVRYLISDAPFHVQMSFLDLEKIGLFRLCHASTMHKAVLLQCGTSTGFR